jgi:hypothetical protein
MAPMLDCQGRQTDSALPPGKDASFPDMTELDLSGGT